MVWIQHLWRRVRGDRERVSEDVQEILDRFQDRIGIRFRRQGLLRQALTHRPFLGSNGGDPRRSNERIEFLGDAVLELAVIEFLYQNYPEDREGSLTKKKGLLVSRDVLAQCADRMGLGDSVLLSEAEREAGGRARASILSDTFESVIGAIHLDQGLEMARRFVRERLLIYADSILQDQSLSNHKSLLQEFVQARFKTHPRYRVVTESGPDHLKLFTVEVAIRGTMLGRGQGHNKKEAEQAAARDALSRLSANGLELPGGTDVSVDAETGA
jgi:ribonuclease III